MNEKQLSLIKNEYLSFKNRITKEIKDNKISYNVQNCFLINDSWIKQLNLKLTKFENNKKDQKTMIDNLFFLPKKGPEFMNNILSAINCFEDGYNLELVSLKLIEYSYGKVFLNNLNKVSYIACNDKIII